MKEPRCLMHIYFFGLLLNWQNKQTVEFSDYKIVDKMLCVHTMDGSIVTYYPLININKFEIEYTSA